MAEKNQGLWDQLQQFAFLSVTDRPVKVLLHCLRHTHLPDHMTTQATDTLQLHRSVYWRLFTGMIPLPPHAMSKREQRKHDRLARKKAERQRKLDAKMSPRNRFADDTTDDDDDTTTDGGEEDSASESDFEKISVEDENDKKKKSKKNKVLSSSSSSSDDDDDDDSSSTSSSSAGKDKKKQPAAKKTNGASAGVASPLQNIQSDFTEQAIIDAIDKGREEYDSWLNRAKPASSAANGAASSASSAAVATSASSSSSSKIKFESKKKAQSAGPRFGDDSSSSSSDDDVGNQNPFASNDQNGNNNSGSNNKNDEDDEEKEVITDPLAHGNDPKWKKYFERKKEMELIGKDLNRLYFNDIEFFEDPATRKMAQNVIEASLDKNVVPNYSQGMHEIVAIILWALWTDANKVAKYPSDHRHRLSKHVCDLAKLEHDAFFIYTRVMKEFDLVSWYENQAPGALNSVTRIVDDIHTRRLARANIDLHDHIKLLDVPCVTYGLRWLRLLFIREFPLSQALKMWDVVLAEYCVERKPVWRSVVPELALSMLLYISRDLLDGDHTNTLRRLMKYPPVEDITFIYQNAIRRAYPDKMGYALRELLPPPTLPPPATVTSLTDALSSSALGAGGGATPTPTSATTTKPGASQPVPQHKDPHQQKGAAAKKDGGGGSMFDTIANLVSSSAHTAVQAISGTSSVVTAATSHTHATGGAGMPPPAAVGGHPQPVGKFAASVPSVQMLRGKQRRLGERLSKVIDTMNTRWFGVPASPAPSPTTALTSTTTTPASNKSPLQPLLDTSTVAALSSSSNNIKKKKNVPMSPLAKIVNTSSDDDDTSSSDDDQDDKNKKKNPPPPPAEAEEKKKPDEVEPAVAPPAAKKEEPAAQQEVKKAEVSDDEYVMAIAELKRIRDALLGDI